MELWAQALAFGLLSTLSLPVGALLGLAMRPSEGVVAKLMGIGAGSLVYAVATQVFGRTLFKLLASSPVGGFGEDVPDECDDVCKALWNDVNLQLAMGLLGALAYERLNHLMLFCMARISPPERARLADSKAFALALSAAEVQGEMEMTRIDGGKGQAALAAAELQGEVSSADSSDGSSDGCTLESRPGSRENSDTLFLCGCAREGSEKSSADGFALEGSREAPRPDSGEPPRGHGGGGGTVALSMWLGLVLDGVPKAIMLGFMTNGGKITFSFLMAVFVANFPEAFAGAAALQQRGTPALQNVLLWSSVFVLTGTIAMVSSLVTPVNIDHGSWLEHLPDDVTVVLQGFTGGATLAMVATAMMPEAYRGAESSVGDMFVLGFGASVLIDGVCAAGLGMPPQAHLHTPRVRGASLGAPAPAA